MTDPAAIVQHLLSRPDRKARLRAMDEFLAGPDAKSLPAVLALFGSKTELRKLLELLSRPKSKLPANLVSKLVPILAERNLPTPLRVSAAAKLIESAPEDHANVKAITAAVTKGLGRSRTFERLVQVQNRVKDSVALDAVVAGRERRVKLQCPKCSARLSRGAFIKHLWFKHRLVFERNRARDPGPLVEDAIRAASHDDSPAAFDRVYALAAVSFRKVEPAQIHQAILARIGADPEALEPLKVLAREHHSGLCPTCFAVVLNPVPPLPAALNLTSHRISGEGFDLDLGEVSPGRRRGTKLALPAALATAAATAFLAPGMSLGIGAGLTGGLYLLGRRRANNSTDPKSAVVDAAWRDLVPKVGRSAAAVRFLTRLCRTSLDHGTAADRAEAVWSQVEQAAVLSGKGGSHLQWFAAVRVLQASDAGHIGKDWIPALTGLFAPLFRAEASPLYTEAAAETLLHAETFEDRDAARLRVFLAGEALSAGITTPDFAILCEHCPHLAKLFAGNDAWYDALRAVWQDRRKRPWRDIADAETVFEYAVNPANGKTLATCPDTLLVDLTNKDLGIILIGQRGLTVEGYVIDSMPSLIQVANQRQWRERDMLKLKRWLSYREHLLTTAAGAMRSPRLPAMLAALATDCPLCRHSCLVKTGEVGTPWPLL